MLVCHQGEQKLFFTQHGWFYVHIVDFIPFEVIYFIFIPHFLFIRSIKQIFLICISLFDLSTLDSDKKCLDTDPYLNASLVVHAPTLWTRGEVKEFKQCLTEDEESIIRINSGEVYSVSCNNIENIGNF